MAMALVKRALMMAVDLRIPAPGLLHRCYRGSQYANKVYRQLLAKNGMVCSISWTGNCLDKHRPSVSSAV